MQKMNGNSRRIRDGPFSLHRIDEERTGRSSFATFALRLSAFDFKADVALLSAEQKRHSVARVCAGRRGAKDSKSYDGCVVGLPARTLRPVYRVLRKRLPDRDVCAASLRETKP
jgi:hypothetical protein